MAGEIAEAAAVASNHGAFVSDVAHLSERWVCEGLNTPADRDRIQSCAAASGVGKKSH